MEGEEVYIDIHCISYVCMYMYIPIFVIQCDLKGVQVIREEEDQMNGLFKERERK